MDDGAAVSAVTAIRYYQEHVTILMEILDKTIGELVEDLGEDDSLEDWRTFTFAALVESLSRQERTRVLTVAAAALVRLAEIEREQEGT
jgi:hypothetical protein